VLNNTGKTAEMKTMMILEAMPTPRAVMKSGASRITGAL
jgi:Ni,Fe-hydrogenase III small subunit